MEVGVFSVPRTRESVGPVAPRAPRLLLGFQILEHASQISKTWATRQ